MNVGRGTLWRQLGVVVLLGGVASGCRAMADTNAESRLREADLAFSRAAAERGAEGWISFFAEDGVIFQPGGPVIGRDSIFTIVSRWFADDAFSLTWEPVRAEVSESGDLGYTYGRYRSTGRDALGKAIHGTGSYVTVWRLQDDGSWKVVADIGNPDG